MLVKCPKCNFTQPKDRYCANCGVDMDNFSRQPDPIGKRIANNAAIYIVIAAALLLGTLWFVRKHQQEELASRVQFLKGGPVIADRQQPLQPLAAPAPAPQNPTAPAAENAAPANEAPKPAEAADSVKVHVLYAEVDHDTMEMLRTESLATQQHTDFGDFKAGALPSKIQPSRERGVRVLEKIDKTFDSKNQSQQWFNGIKGPEGQEHLGLTTLLSLDRNGQGNLRGEVEVMRLFNEANEAADAGPVRRNYPSTSFELTPGMSWMITVRLPTIAQEEPGQASDGVMRIFNSPQYKSRQTEFTIFFEFDTPTATPNPAKN